MKPRVLFLSPQPFFQWRGSPIRVQYNLRALSDLGYEVDLITLPFGEDVEIPNVKIHRVSGLFGLKDVPIGPSIWKLLFDVKIYGLACRLLKQQRYEVIHGIEEAGFLGIFLARKFSTRLIYEKHSDPKSYRKNLLRNLVMDAYAKVEAYTIRRADAIIVTGQGLEAAVREISPEAPCTHLFDIPSSLREADPEQTRQRRDSLVQNEGEILATYVGSFAVYQGIEMLFASIPLALQQAPQLRFIIIGGSPTEIAAQRATLEKAGAASQVTFVGKVDPEALPGYLSASDLLLSPRISGNNTPLKLLDYLKAGRAIVATDLEANRLILDEDMCSFAGCQPGEFAQAIADLANDPDLRGKKAVCGRRLIDETYNFTNYTQRLKAIYEPLRPSQDTP